jgi:hypothetical protein
MKNEQIVMAIAPETLYSMAIMYVLAALSVTDGIFSP